MKYVLSTEVQSRDASDDSSTESSGLKDWAIDRDGLEVEVAISALAMKRNNMYCVIGT
jgi:hypothetical protein